MAQGRVPFLIAFFLVTRVFIMEFRPGHLRPPMHGAVLPTRNGPLG